MMHTVDEKYITVHWCSVE